MTPARQHIYGKCRLSKRESVAATPQTWSTGPKVITATRGEAASQGLYARVGATESVVL